MYKIEEFPFRIKKIRTDNGRKLQAKFHWHVENQGISRACIKRGTPQLNGKVKRSHRSDQQEFYQLLSYKDGVDFEAKLSEWENFYTCTIQYAFSTVIPVLPTHKPDIQPIQTNRLPVR